MKEVLPIGILRNLANWLRDARAEGIRQQTFEGVDNSQLRADINAGLHQVDRARLDANMQAGLPESDMPITRG